MKRKQVSARVLEETFDLVELMSSLSGEIGRGKMLDSIIEYMVENHGVAEIVQYTTTLEFKDGRKKNGGS